MTPSELATKAQDLKDQFDCMKLSESEFKELVNDLIITQTIDNDALYLEENIKECKIYKLQPHWSYTSVIVKK
jgi:hypothetical protein